MTSPDSDRPAAPREDTAANLETAGWGVFFIWVGVCFLAGLSWGTFFFGTGILMLGTQALRRRFGLRLDRFSLAVGTCLVVVGAIHALEWRLDEVTMPAWLVPALFIVVGAAFLVSAWKRRPKT